MSHAQRLPFLTRTGFSSISFSSRDEGELPRRWWTKLASDSVVRMKYVNIKGDYLSLSYCTMCWSWGWDRGCEAFADSDGTGENWFGVTSSEKFFFIDLHGHLESSSNRKLSMAKFKVRSESITNLWEVVTTSSEDFPPWLFTEEINLFVIL